MKTIMRGMMKEERGIGDYVYHDDLPVPEIEDDEVLIKVRCTAICGSDMHIMEWDPWTDKHVTPPVIPGHETAGDIVAVGKNVKDRKVGDRVSCESHIACGECWFCKNGMPHICKNIKLFGCQVNGAFAEYTKVPARATFLLDDSISYEAACLFEPMGSGIHGVESANVEGKTVLVSGCGPIGLTAIAGCKTFGATMVIACDLFDDKLELGKNMGADYVFNSGKVDLVKEVQALTNGVGVDAVIDVTGAEPALRTGLKCVRAAGRMVCVGLPTKPVTLELANDLIYREVEFTGVSGRKIWETWEDFTKVMNGPYYDLESALGHRFALEDFDKALVEIRNNVPGKMLIYPDPSVM